MDIHLLEVLLLLAGIGLGFLFASRVHALGTKAVSEIHALYNEGLISEKHVVDYVEAKIATEKASAESMLAHAKAASVGGRAVAAVAAAV